MFRLPPAYVWSGPFIHSLGYIIVEISGLYTNNFSVKFYNPDHLAKVTHPELKGYLPSGEHRTMDAAHVRAGTGCLGNLGGMIDSAIREGDIVDLVSLCRSYVNTANEDDTYGRSIVFWPSVPATIHNIVKYGMVNRLDKNSCIVVDGEVKKLCTLSIEDFAKLVETNRELIMDTSYRYSDVIESPNRMMEEATMRNYMPRTYYTESSRMLKAYMNEVTVPSLLSEDEIRVQIDSLDRMVNMTRKEWNKLMNTSHPEQPEGSSKVFKAPDKELLLDTHAKRVKNGMCIKVDGSEIVKQTINEVSNDAEF